MANISDFIGGATGGGGGLNPVLANTANETVVAANNDFVLVVAAGVTINLPASPEVGDRVRVHNRAGMGVLATVFPGTNTIIDQTNDPIRGHFNVVNRGSFEFFFNGGHWDLVFSGYLIPDDPANLPGGLSNAYSTTENNAAVVTFSRTVNGVAVGNTDNINTADQVRIQANVVDPDSTADHTFLWSFDPDGSFTVEAGGGVNDPFITFSNANEQTTTITVEVQDPSGNTTTAQHVLTFLNNIGPTPSLDAVAGTAEVGDDITTEVVNIIDPDEPGTFPGNSDQFMYMWNTPAGTTITAGCGINDTTCTISSANTLIDAEITVEVVDSQGGTGTSAPRNLSWALAGPTIASTGGGAGGQGSRDLVVTIPAPTATGIFSTVLNADPRPNLPALTANNLRANQIVTVGCDGNASHTFYAYTHNTNDNTFSVVSISTVTATHRLGNGSFMLGVNGAPAGLTVAVESVSAPLQCPGNAFSGASNSFGVDAVLTDRSRYINSSSTLPTWTIGADSGNSTRPNGTRIRYSGPFVRQANLPAPGGRINLTSVGGAINFSTTPRATNTVTAFGETRTAQANAGVTSSSLTASLRVSAAANAGTSHSWAYSYNVDGDVDTAPVDFFTNPTVVGTNSNIVTGLAATHNVTATGGSGNITFNTTRPFQRGDFIQIQWNVRRSVTADGETQRFFFPSGSTTIFWTVPVNFNA